MELARTLNRITCCGTTTNTFVIQIEILFSKATSNCTLIQRWPSTGNFNVRKISQNNLWRNVLRGYQAGHKSEMIISSTFALDASKIELGTLCGNLASVANFMFAGGFCFWNLWFNFNVCCTLSARAAATTLTADTDPVILSTICPTVDIRTFDAKSNKKQQPGPTVTMFYFRKHFKWLCFDVFWRTDQTARPNVEKRLKQTPIVAFMVVRCARPPAQDASKEISIHLFVSPWNLTSVSNFALKTQLKLVVKWQVNLLNPSRGWTRSSLRFPEGLVWKCAKVLAFDNSGYLDTHFLHFSNFDQRSKKIKTHGSFFLKQRNNMFEKIGQLCA